MNPGFGHARRARMPGHGEAVDGGDQSTGVALAGSLPTTRIL